MKSKFVLNATCLLVLVLLSLPPPAAAQVTYAFAFVPTNTYSGNPIEPFSFSFSSPDFVTDGTVVSFTPFDITDGTNSELIAFGGPSMRLTVEGGVAFIL
jgi:hypothetical protein